MDKIKTITRAIHDGVDAFVCITENGNTLATEVAKLNLGQGQTHEQKATELFRDYLIEQAKNPIPDEIESITRREFAGADCFVCRTKNGCAEAIKTDDLGAGLSDLEMETKARDLFVSWIDEMKLQAKQRQPLRAINP